MSIDEANTVALTDTERLRLPDGGSLGVSCLSACSFEGWEKFICVLNVLSSGAEGGGIRGSLPVCSIIRFLTTRPLSRVTETTPRVAEEGIISGDRFRFFVRGCCRGMMDRAQALIDQRPCTSQAGVG